VCIPRWKQTRPCWQMWSDAGYAGAPGRALHHDSLQPCVQKRLRRVL